MQYIYVSCLVVYVKKHEGKILHQKDYVLHRQEYKLLNFDVNDKKDINEVSLVQMSYRNNFKTPNASY